MLGGFWGCPKCLTDDLMRHLSGVGVEYGYEWVIEYLLDLEVEDISEEQQEEIFMDFIDSAYGEDTGIAFTSVNTGLALKNLDSVAFDMAMKEYFSEDAHVEIGAKLYCITTIEVWAEEQISHLTKEGATA